MLKKQDPSSYRPRITSGPSALQRAAARLRSWAFDPVVLSYGPPVNSAGRDMMLEQELIRWQRAIH